MFSPMVGVFGFHGDGALLFTSSRVPSRADEDDEELAGLKGRLVKRKEHAGEEDGS
jgi:hypothetical protein